MTLAAWKKHKCADNWQLIVADVEHRQRDDRSWREGFIPMPTTYLNQERWTDDIDTTRPNAAKEEDDWRERYARGEDIMRSPVAKARIIEGEVMN